MATPRAVLQAKLDELNAEIAGNPIVVDGRIAKLNELQAEVFTTTPWYDAELDDVQAFIAKYL